MLWRPLNQLPKKQFRRCQWSKLARSYWCWVSSLASISRTISTKASAILTDRDQSSRGVRAKRLTVRSWSRADLLGHGLTGACAAGGVFQHNPPKVGYTAHVFELR